MRISANTYVVATALVALFFVAGCGDSNDTNIDIGDGSTPTAGVRTAPPVRTSTPSGATPTSSNPTPTATPGAIDADVQMITSDIVPFLAGTSLLTGGSVSALTVANAAIGQQTTAEAVTNDCPDGGTRVDDEGVPVRTITLTACKGSVPDLGSFQFDGTVVITLTSLTGGTIDFDFTTTDLSNDHTVDFFGTLVLTVSGGNFVLNGPLLISTDEGDFTVTTNAITINSNRKLVSGSGSITDDDDSFAVDTIDMTVVQGGQTASFSVTFDDSSVHTYSVNLQIGIIIQTS
jgi:hypothetical protein